MFLKRFRKPRLWCEQYLPNEGNDNDSAIFYFTLEQEQFRSHTKVTT